MTISHIFFKRPLCPQYPDPAVKFCGYLPAPFEETYDELECLNLSISTPHFALGGSTLLPVMVYVHGGGNAFGTGTNYGITDARNLVRLSMKEGKDVVVVAFDYRVNWLGFLASKVSNNHHIEMELRSPDLRL